MKKKSFWSLFAVMMVSVLCLGLASCSDDDDDDEGGNVNLENVEPGVLTGKWQCTRIACVEDGEKYDRDIDESYCLILNEDGTAVATPGDLYDDFGYISSETKIYWSGTGNILTLSYSNGYHHDTTVLTVKKLTRNELVTESFDGDDYTETHTFRKVAE